MKRRLLFLFCLLTGLRLAVQASILTVTTTNNAGTSASDLSFLQAVSTLRDGDEIRFNIPGPGPHYIETPPGGYPLITNNNITINGYSQPGASPNSNPLLAPNLAKLSIVLDSRSGGGHAMVLDGTAPTDDPGFDQSISAVLGADRAQSLKIVGLSFLGVPTVGSLQQSSLSFIALARGASAQVSGCWLGVDPDGTTVAGAANGITGLRYEERNIDGTVTATHLISGVVLGVVARSTNAVQQFNVWVGMPSVPILLEGDNTRISGNFITVLPDGMHDVDVALDDNLKGSFGGDIEIGRGGNNTLIGTDGDGLNDENERNVFGGMLPTALGGYDHLIEFYNQDPGTNVVFAGNYVGVAIDGKTKFTNGVPVMNASGASAQYRIGSNFDNLSDKTEGNLISNNYPSDLFPASNFQQMTDSLNFLSQLNVTGAVLLRGNSLINNFPFPASPLRDNGSFLVDYYAQALVDSSQGVTPTLSTNSTLTRLIGTIPAVNLTVYPATAIDVYIADPVGLTNGAAAGIPALPQGFVQGATYLGSFVENSAADLDSVRGSFAFDISKLNLAAGTALTITASYLAPTGFFLPASLNPITRAEDGGLIISWTGAATLQSASDPAGPWSDEITTGNSFESSGSELAQFYRLQLSGTGTGSAAPPLTSPFSNSVQVH